MEIIPSVVDFGSMQGDFATDAYTEAIAMASPTSVFEDQAKISAYGDRGNWQDENLQQEFMYDRSTGIDSIDRSLGLAYAGRADSGYEEWANENEACLTFANEVPVCEPLTEVTNRMEGEWCDGIWEKRQRLADERRNDWANRKRASEDNPFLVPILRHFVRWGVIVALVMIWSRCIYVIIAHERNGTWGACMRCPIANSGVWSLYYCIFSPTYCLLRQVYT